MAQTDSPRLVLRFAVSTCIALALAAGAILMIVRHLVTVQAERAATSQARVIASSALRGALRPSDFSDRVADSRRTALDRLFQAGVLDEGVLLVELYDTNGRVTYSTDHRRIGRRAIAELTHLQEARAGTVRGDATALPSGKALRTYAPVAEAAASTFFPTAGVFEAVLILLFVALVPLLRRVTIRIRRQMDEIEHRALYDQLTELPNRTLFHDRVEQALARAQRDGSGAAVMFLDVNHFKEIND